MSASKTWTFSGIPHLYRHQKGTYYARLSIGGKPTFRSLKTKVLSVAKPQLNEILQDNAHRDELGKDTVITEKMTGAEALAIRESQLQNDPSTKKSTKRLRGLRQTGYIADCEAKKIRELIPYK